MAADTTIAAAPLTLPKGRFTLGGHIYIMRFDHWIKNVFILPGVIVALAMDRSHLNMSLIWRLALGLIATGFVASSNYVINELLDAPNDLHHPIKNKRAVPAGRVSWPIAYIQWIATGALGMVLAIPISMSLFWTLAALWVMGCIYNLPPIRSKDLPILDVISESVNNPLRMLAGWYIVGPTMLAPASLLLSYWMVGCYFMAIKRYAEFIMIGDSARAGAYRKSFRYYTAERLLVSIMFYAACAMLFFGAFIMRYRIELILSFPMVALVMAIYLHLAFKHDSAVQAPEKLYKEWLILLPVTLCAGLMIFLLLVDLPWVHEVFSPFGPVQQK